MPTHALFDQRETRAKGGAGTGLRLAPKPPPQAAAVTRGENVCVSVVCNWEHSVGRCDRRAAVGGRRGTWVASTRSQAVAMVGTPPRFRASA